MADARNRRSGGHADGPGNSGRDADRSKVYEAEGLVRRLQDRSYDFPTIEVAGSHLTLPVERRFGSVESVQTYVEAVLALPSVRQVWPGRAAVPVAVRERRGQSGAHYEYAGAVMAVPTQQTADGAPWAMRELVVLHELAHHLVGADVTHGRDFRAAMLELVDLVVGPELRLLLLVTYADCGIDPV